LVSRSNTDLFTFSKVIWGPFAKTVIAINAIRVKDFLPPPLACLSQMFFMKAGFGLTHLQVRKKINNAKREGKIFARPAKNDLKYIT
jgi:hypothetical protein